MVSTPVNWTLNISLSSAIIAGLSLIVLAVVGSAIAQNNNQCPNIITRQQWGALLPSGPIKPLVPPSRHVSIFQTSTRPCFNVYECIYQVRIIQAQDMEAYGNIWNDIPFSYLIGGDGNVYEGRGCLQEGGVSSYTDDIALDVAFIGNFNDFPPSDRMLQTARRLLNCGKAMGSISLDYTILGERQLLYSHDSAYALYDRIQYWPEWNNMYWEKK